MAPDDGECRGHDSACPALTGSTAWWLAGLGDPYLEALLGDRRVSADAHCYCRDHGHATAVGVDEPPTGDRDAEPHGLRAVLSDRRGATGERDDQRLALSPGSRVACPEHGRQGERDREPAGQ